MLNDSLGHVMGVTDQICLEVSIKVLWDVAKVIISRSMLLVRPSLGELPIQVHLRKIIGGNQLCRSAWVQMRAKLVSDFNGHLGYFTHFVCYKFHCLNSFKSQLVVVVLVLHLDHLPL